MAGALGFLAGLGQAAQGLPQGLEAAQKQAMQQEHADLLQRQLAQNQSQFEASRQADVPTELLPSAYRMQAGGAPTVKLPTSVLPFAATQGAAERKQELESKQGAIMGNTLRQIGTPEAKALAALVEGGGGNNAQLMSAAENVMKMAREGQQRQQGNALVAALLSNDPAKIQAALSGAPAAMAPPAAPAPEPRLGPPRFQPTGGMPSEAPPSVLPIGVNAPAANIQQAPTIAGDVARYRQQAAQETNPDTRRALLASADAAERLVSGAGPGPARPAAIPPSGPPALTPAAAPGAVAMQHEFTIDPATGKVTVHVKPPPQATPGAEYVKAVTALQALEDAGVPKTDPQYIRQALHVDRLKPMALQQGGFISGPSGTGGPLAAGPVPPVPEPITQDIRGIAGIRVAAQQVKESLKDPAVLGYIGPAAQYRSTAQMKTPMGLLGNVPPAVVDMEQNLARIKNYTIKLITGAQMSQPEAQRIMQELPDQGTPPDVFSRRLDNTMAAIQGMEQRTLQMALRGDQRAVLVATELGLMKPGQQQGTAPGATAPAARGVVKWGRDAQGNPVPLP